MAAKFVLPEWLKLVKGDLEDGDEDVEMTLAEPVGFDPMTYTGMSSRVFGQALTAIPKKKKVILNINTLGGDVTEGTAMHNMLLARGNVTTRVIGYAASMGAVIMQAGAVRQMMPGTMCVIHNPKAQITGDGNELRSGAEYADQVKCNLVDLLSARTKLSKKKISDMMDAVTSMCPAEAKENGFCDEIIDGSPAWNNLDMPKIFNSFRAISLRGDATGIGIHPQPKTKANTMKKLTDQLVALGLISAASLHNCTEDDAMARIVADAFGKTHNDLNAMKAERDALQTKCSGYDTEKRTRITGIVDKAITDKIVAADAKDGLIELGMKNESYLNFFNSIRQNAAPRRGAPPVPPATGETGEDKLKALREEMLASDTSPERRAQCATEMRDLRGHKNLFKPEEVGNRI